MASRRRRWPPGCFRFRLAGYAAAGQPQRPLGYATSFLTPAAGCRHCCRCQLGRASLSRLPPLLLSFPSTAPPPLLLPPLPPPVLSRRYAAATAAATPAAAAAAAAAAAFACHVAIAAVPLSLPYAVVQAAKLPRRQLLPPHAVRAAVRRRRLAAASRFPSLSLSPLLRYSQPSLPAAACFRRQPPVAAGPLLSFLAIATLLSSSAIATPLFAAAAAAAVRCRCRCFRRRCRRCCASCRCCRCCCCFAAATLPVVRPAFFSVHVTDRFPSIRTFG